MDGFDGDDYFHGDVDGYDGGDPYGNIESTRDFLSQPYASNGGFNTSSYAYLGSSSHGRSSNTCLPRTNVETPGIKEVIKQYFVATNLKHNRDQISTRIRQLRQLFGFIQQCTKDTGLGRNSDGTINASDEWWNANTKGHGEWKKLKNGWPIYMNELEQMFQGIAVDGSTSFVAEANDIVDEEEEEEEPSLNVQTPTSSNRNKRASSSTTCASSPNKKSKSKSQAFKIIDRVMTQQNKIAEDRNQLLERQFEMKAEQKRKAREEERNAKDENICLVQQMARDCGVDARNTRLWYTVLKICKDKETMAFFKNTEPHARLAFIEYLANVNN